ncbi:MULTISPECIES: class II aldolase/adducin family protein [Streptomyces]|uniref:class II aldolase/adducin family protein n=1 Tax=Streptomyces TaxID=1883 RepID=UPI001F2A00B1|nr:class II aldolase/adducin family protein [Streptomyces noursei]MCE4947439.1 class II aldolase/adducin family protein [Streptomyces noursei]
MPEPTPIPTEHLQFAMPPTHAGVEEERRHRKERLVAALRLFGRYGFEEGVSGHVTVRDPEFADCFWVNPFGMSFALLTVSDLVLVNGDGKVVEGRHHVNQAAFTIHAQVHRARPDVVAAAHCHSTYGRALSALGELLDPITQDVCAFYEDHALYDAYTGVVVDEEEGRRIAAALGPYKAVILRNHGLLTVGDSVDAAAWWFLTMERCCQVQLTAKAAGKPVLISPQDAVRTREQLGTDLVAWINYQSLYQQIARSEPEMFG